MHLKASWKDTAHWGSLEVRTKMTVNEEVSKPGTKITKKKKWNYFLTQLQKTIQRMVIKASLQWSSHSPLLMILYSAALQRSGFFSTVILWPGNNPNRCDKCLWLTLGSWKSSACIGRDDQRCNFDTQYPQCKFFLTILWFLRNNQFNKMKRETKMQEDRIWLKNYDLPIP